MAKRASLSTFTPQHAEPADGGKVIAAPIPAAAEAVKKGAKYPSVTVYLTAEEKRTFQLLAVETGERVSDICARALREWLEKNGHARGKLFKA